MDLTAEQYEILFGERPSGEPRRKPAPAPPQATPVKIGAPPAGLSTRTFDAPPEAYDSPNRPTVSLVRVAEPEEIRPEPDRSPKAVLIALTLFVILVLSPLALLQFRDDPDVEVLNEAVVAVDPNPVETSPRESDAASTNSVPGLIAAERDRALGALAAAEVSPTSLSSADFNADGYQANSWPDSDGDCQSDREEVLIEESLEEPSLDVDGCRVVGGRWIDAFTGQEHVDPEDLVVERLVPLEIAHSSGADVWTQAQQRAYAVDAAFGPSLVVVSEQSVQSRNSMGPDMWRPIEPLWCRYAIDWISVKSRWSLSYTTSEADGLSEMLTTCGLESAN